MLWIKFTDKPIFIAIFMDSGFWQVVAYKEERAYIYFLIPNGKRCWKYLPMGSLNSAPICVVIVTNIQYKWYLLSQ